MPQQGGDIQKLGMDMLRFTAKIDEYTSPDEVLDGLHHVTLQNCKLSVLGAYMFPLRWGDWDAALKERNLFLHRSVPDGWWEEYDELRRKYPGVGVTLAQLALAPFTMSEIMRSLEPIGIERWPLELAMKYRMRDSLTCPVGGRWAVAYWSRHVLSGRLTDEERAILFMGATFAAIRLQKLSKPQPDRLGVGSTALTPRELAVLRLASVGKQLRQIADLLGLGEETVRSHMKKAQAKLGVGNRVHAVAQAIRRHLIP
jgi:LuxR family quorum sensing-dependent transcriptional regulator